MKVGEWGKKIRCSTQSQGNTGYDMSGNTLLTLIFTKKDSTKLTKTSAEGVTAPAEAFGTWPASTYFEYTTIQGDIDLDGAWDVYGIYDDGTKRFISKSARFTVDS